MKNKQVVFVEGRTNVEIGANSKIIRTATSTNTVTMSIDDFIYLQDHIKELESSSNEPNEKEDYDPFREYVKGLRKG